MECCGNELGADNEDYEMRVEISPKATLTMESQYARASQVRCDAIRMLQRSIRSELIYGHTLLLIKKNKFLF